jgi:hypothetical protein
MGKPMVRTIGVLGLLGVVAAACSGGSIRKVDGGSAGSGAAGTSTGGAAGTSTGGSGGLPTGGAAGTSTGGSDAAVDASSAGANGAAGASSDASASDAPADTKADAAAEANAGDAGAPDATTSEVGVDAGADLNADVTGELPPAMPVKVGFSGQVVTVASAPLGFDSTVRLEAVSGSFTYDLRMVDQLPADPKRGRYEGFTITAFTFTVKGHTITGSGNAQVQTEDLDPDTFRFLDGPLGDNVPRVMKFDGADAPTLKLGIAITDSSGAMLSSEALPHPFPTLDITTKPHTFSLQDGGGTLLMQLDALTPL